MSVKELSQKIMIAWSLITSSASAASLNTDHPVEVTCGIVYSVGAQRAHGGWPNTIRNTTGDHLRTHILHLHYAPFVQVHNPGLSTIRYNFATNGQPKVTFEAPPLSLHFERLSGATTGFMSNTPNRISNLYVFNPQTPKTFVFKLSSQPLAAELVLLPGETKIFRPNIPPTYTWNDDRVGDGALIYDWRNNQTANITAISSANWQGAAYAYSADWLGGNGTNSATANAGLGVIATRPEDTWNIAISKSGTSLLGHRVFKIPATPSATWPMEPSPALELTSFPQQTKDLSGVFSTSNVNISGTTQIQNRVMNPIFSITAPCKSSTLRTFIDRDADGLDDDWERLYFGNLSQDGTADSDGDGDPDSKEYITGTSPVDQSDILGATLTESGANFVLNWPYNEWRKYEIQESSNLSQWTTIRTVEMTSHSPNATRTLSETISPDTNENRFYRVKVSNRD